METDNSTGVSSSGKAHLLGRRLEAKVWMQPVSRKQQLRDVKRL